MESREERRRRLEEAAQQADAAAAELLHSELEILKTRLDRLDEVRPQLADDATYDKLIAAVEEATAQNLSLAQLKDNITKLGKGAVDLAKELAGAAKSLA